MNRSTMHRIINNPEKCAQYIRRQPGHVVRTWRCFDGAEWAEYRAVVSGAGFWARSVNGEFVSCGVEYVAPAGFASF